MGALPDHFAELIRKTLPSGERLDLAQKWPSRIREHIEQHEFGTVSPQSRLAGSYGRKTAVKDIKDVDVIVFVPPEAETDSPKSLLGDLEDALEDYPDATIDCTQQRRSVRVRIVADDFDIDVVPAIIDEEDHHGVLLVPDKNRGGWVRSQPIGYADSLTALNQQHGGKVKAQVRLLKLWRDLHMTYNRPKSYWLECLVFHAFNEGSVETDGKSSGLIFSDLLAALINRLAPSVDGGGVPFIADPMLGNNVATGWDNGRAEALLSRLRSSADTARKALETEDDAEALDMWTLVFPGEFPTDANVGRDAWVSAIHGNKAAVTASGLLLPTRTPDTINLRPASAWGDSHS